MKKFFVIAHTHWDREWHKTYQENRTRLIGFIDDLFETLEQDPDYNCFVLDGQTSLILDYLEIKPYNKDKFHRFIKENRIIVGPWYVQPDENIPSGEAMIRNLLISKNISDEYGDYMKLGYLPDSFGQSGSMPTILRAFGIDSAMFYRGITEQDISLNEFIWQGYDNSQVLAVWLPIGYGNGMFLSSETRKSVKEIETNLDMLEKRSVSENYALMCGCDQSFVKKFLPKTCLQLEDYYGDKGYEFSVSSLEEYIDALRPYKDQMPVVKGDMRKGKHSRTHISIAATRMDIKKANFNVDAKYKFVLEPLSALLDIIGKKTYENELINRGWRFIIENHAHDSICCCCTDEVHQEMLGRISYAQQIANTIIKESFERLHQLIAYNENYGRPIVLFSSFLGERTELVFVDVYVKIRNFRLYNEKGCAIDYGVHGEATFNRKDTIVALNPIADDIYTKVSLSFYATTKGYGYTTYYINEGEDCGFEKVASLAGCENTLENDFIRVEVKPDGAIDLLDKKSSIEYKNQHILVDTGNAGDEYDYSPPEHDQVYKSLNKLTSLKLLENTSTKATLALSYLMEVPKTTFANERSEEKVDLVIDTEISLYRNDCFVDFKTVIHNNAMNHRLQAVFDLGTKANHHFADVQTGEIQRENLHELTEESEKEGWSERYYPIYIQQKHVALETENHFGIMVASKGLPQYEIIERESTKVGLTLLSSVGMMGNENLLYRKGRRSGAVCETPDAQMLGENICEYRLILTAPETDRPKASEGYVNHITAISYPIYNTKGMLPDKLIVASGEDGVILNAFKKSEDKTGYIARLANQSMASIEGAKVAFNPSLFLEAHEVTAAEVPLQKGENKIIIGQSNNPDGSDKDAFSGETVMEDMGNNTVISLKLI